MLPDFLIQAYIDQHKMVSDYRKNNIQPCSLDIRLSNQFRFAKANNNYENFCVDPFDKKSIEKCFSKTCTMNEPILLPGVCVLASTIESVDIPDNIVCEVHGKSSLGRLFLIVHATAGLVDPGFKGNITLEIINHAPFPIKLKYGMSIAQLTFTEMRYSCKNKYVGKYQNQGHAVLSAYHKNIQ